MRTLGLGMLVAACATAGCEAEAPSDTTSGTSSQTSTATSTGSGGTGTGGSSSGTGGSSCPTCGDVMNAGTLANGAITEASGIVRSRDHAGVYYVHNDSGDSARFFAIGSDGSDQGTFDVTGATAIDWEDLGRGPCADPSKSCIFLGDIGDNPEARADYVVYRTAEPATIGAGNHTVTADAIRFVYPDGPHNAEALFVDPTSGAIVIVTKNANASRIYRLAPPFDTAGVATATDLGTASVPDVLPLVTGADVAPDRTAILLRTYSSVWRFALGSGEAVESALAKTPCLLTTPTEMQGEAIAWAGGTTGFVTLSEGTSPELHAVTCR